MTNSTPVPKSWVRTPVAWKEEIDDGKGGKIDRIHRGFVLQPHMANADGSPASYLIAITSPHKYQDSRTRIMSAEEIPAAFEFFTALYVPPPFAQHLVDLMVAAQKMAVATDFNTARRKFLQTILSNMKAKGPGTKLPDNVRMSLAWAKEVNGQQLTGSTARLVRIGECYTLVVSEDIFTEIRSAAILSKLFDETKSLERLMEEAAEK
jgi:hypothetical protein